MDGFYISTLILALLAGPAGLVVAIIALRRSARLEKELQRAGARRFAADLAGTATPTPTTSSTTVPGMVPPPPPPPSPAYDHAPQPASMPDPTGSRRPSPRKASVDLETILGGQWLTWIGVLAIFFGTAFFLGVDLGSHALAGLAQVVIGFVVALAFCGIGRIWSQSEQLRFLGLGLLGGGVALLYTVCYAAYGFHDLVDAWAIYPLLLVVAIAGALLALDRHSLTVAALTLTGSLLAPILLPQAKDPGIALLPYLVAVNLGAVLVGYRRGWAGLPLAAFIGSSILITGWMTDGLTPARRNFALIAVGASWLVFALSPWVRQGKQAFWGVARGTVTAANGLLFGLFCYFALAPDATDLRGPALALLAIVYVVLSQYLLRTRPKDPGARISFHTGIALATIAILVQLDLSWITIGWTALATLLLAHGLYRDDRSHRLAGLAVLALAMIRVVISDRPIIQDAAREFHFLLNGEFLAGFAVAGVLGWSAWSYRRLQLRPNEFEKKLATPMLLAGVSVLWWKATTELIAWWQLRESVSGTDAEPMFYATLSLFWAAYGGGVVVAGMLARFRPLRRFGLLLLGIATVKVVIWDAFAGRDPALGIQPFLSLPFLAGMVLVLVLSAIAWQFRTQARRLSPSEARFPTPLLLTALCVLIWQFSVEIIYLFSLREYLGQASSERQSLLTLSLVWTLYSSALIAAGFVARFKALRLLGIVLLGITVLKVFFVDLTVLEKGYRVAAFVGLGILVLAVSLLYQRLRPKDPS